MSSALIGLVGVIAGVLVTGGVQAILTSRDRRRDARVAAALIFADLATAREMLDAVLAGDAAAPPASDLYKFLEVWREQRRPLALGVSPFDFHTIAGAFNILANAASGIDVGPPLLSDKLGVLTAVEFFDRATEVAWRASGMETSFGGTNTAHNSARTES